MAIHGNSPSRKQVESHPRYDKHIGNLLLNLVLPVITFSQENESQQHTAYCYDWHQPLVTDLYELFIRVDITHINIFLLSFVIDALAPVSACNLSLPNG